MIPIRNRKKTLQMTVDEMRNFAFAYLEKYSPSKQQLKTYLLKKYLTTSSIKVKKQDITNLIDIVLSDLEKNKFINDKYYSDTKAKSMIGRGNSINKIRSYLFGKWIRDNLINETMNKIKDENSDQDFFSAIKIWDKIICAKIRFIQHKNISSAQDKNRENRGYKNFTKFRVWQKN